MVDPDEALNLLFEDNAGRPDDLRAAFSELCRQPRIDEPLRSIDAGGAWVLYKIAGELTDPAAEWFGRFEDAARAWTERMAACSDRTATARNELLERLRAEAERARATLAEARRVVRIRSTLGRPFG